MKSEVRQSMSRRWLSLVSLMVLITAVLGCALTPRPDPPDAGPTVDAALPTTAPEDDGEEAPGEEATEAPSEPEQAGAAPGTVILDETQTISAGAGTQAVYVFESSPMQTVRIEAAIIGGSMEYQLQLLDQFDNALAGIQSSVGRTVEVINEFTLPYQGEYRLAVTPIEGQASLKVTVTALGPPSGGGQLANTDSGIAGLMSSARIYHTYVFGLTEGEVVTIGARSNVEGAPDVLFQLYGPDGRYITSADDIVQGIELDAVIPSFVPSVAGNYVAIVTNYGESIGAYVFNVTSDTVAPEAAGDPDIAYGGEFRAAFFDRSNLSATFDGAVGDVISISVFAAGPDLDVDVYLYSPFEQIIGRAFDARQGEGESIAEIQLPYDGRYRLELRPIGEGEASFRVDLLDRSALTGGGSFGDQASATAPGVINARNVFHIYQFEAAAGESVTLSIESTSTRGSLDLGFAVIGPNGLQMAFADHSTGANVSDPALEGYSLNQTGVYTIIVYSYNDATGSYELSFSKN